MAVNYTVGNWKPHKGGPPADPPPLGALPKGPNPRFPTVGAREPSPPAGGYQSIISTKAPLDAAAMNRVTDMFTPAQSARKTAGDQSRAAFSRALADTSKGELGRSADEFNQQYRAQSEKSRAEDVLTQRQSAADRFRMELFAQLFGADTMTRYTEGVKDLRQYFETEKANEQAKRTAIIMRFLGSLL